MKIFYTTKYLKTEESKKYFLNKAINIYLGFQEEKNLKLNIEKTSNGKPYIQGFPEFSISHKNNYLAIAISNTPIGIDIETEKEVKENIIKKFFSKNDYENYKNNKISGIELWCKKEALIKAYGGTVFDKIKYLGENDKDNRSCTMISGIKYYMQRIKPYKNITGSISFTSKDEIIEEIYFE